MYEILLLGSYFIVVLGFFVLGLVVILRQHTLLYRRFAMFAFLVGVWQALQFVAQLVSSNHDIAVGFLQASIAISAVMATAFLTFMFAYVGKKIWLWFAYGLGLLAGLASLFSRTVQDVQITTTGIGVPELDVWYGITLGYAGLCIVYAIVLAIVFFKNAKKQELRQQARIILASTLIAGLIIVLASFWTSDFSNSTLGQHVVPLACLVAMVGFVYAIAFRGLFDIKVFVLRAAAYLTTFFALTIVFVIPIVLIFDGLFDLRPSNVEFIAVVLITVSALYILQYVRHVFDKLTRDVFFRQLYDPQEVFDALSNALVHSSGVDEIKKWSSQVLANALRPERIGFVLHDGQDEVEQILVRELSRTGGAIIITDELGSPRTSLQGRMRDRGIALAIRLKTKHEELGFMIVGHKQSGEFYTQRDKKMLSIAADEIATALQSALRLRQIERFNATLQEKIEDATQKLRESNRRLKLLDQTKDDFISMASHQLRTPLTSVKGYVSMVLDGDAGKISDTQRKLLNQSYVSAQRMVYLISDLLNVSRLRTGKFVIEPAPSDLAAVVADEVDQLKETAKSHSVTLQYRRPTSFPRLMLDENKLRQVIMNFIDNAIYYTPTGGKIEVAVRELPNSIEFTVTDSGIGVPKREQHNLFSKFYRASNAKRARPDGTGLGLFMAKKVVIAQGGATIFKSQEGKGSTFGFTLPKGKLLAPEQEVSPPKK